MAEKYSEDDLDKAEDLIKSFDNPEVVQAVQKERSIDPMEGLRNDLFGFFKEQIENINKSEDFLEHIKDALLAKIDENEMSAPQLIKLFEAASEKIIQSKDILNSLFRPAPGGGITPIITMTSGDNQLGGNFITPIDSKSAEGVDKIMRLLQKIADDK